MNTNDDNIAIKEAIRANKLIGKLGDCYAEEGIFIDDAKNYSIEDVCFEILSEIIKRTDWLFKDGNMIAFSD